MSDEVQGQLYDRLAELSKQLAGLGSDESHARTRLEDKVDATRAELRRLQTEETEHFRRAFEASLELPLGEGPPALEEAQALISTLERKLEPELEA